MGPAAKRDGCGGLLAPGNNHGPGTAESGSRRLGSPGCARPTSKDARRTRGRCPAQNDGAAVTSSLTQPYLTAQVPSPEASWKPRSPEITSLSVTVILEVPGLPPPEAATADAPPSPASAAAVAHGVTHLDLPGPARIMTIAWSADRTICLRRWMGHPARAAAGPAEVDRSANASRPSRSMN